MPHNCKINAHGFFGVEADYQWQQSRRLRRLCCFLFAPSAAYGQGDSTNITQIGALALSAVILGVTSGAANGKRLPNAVFAYITPTIVSAEIHATAVNTVRETELVVKSPSTGHRFEALLFQPTQPSGSHSGVLFVHWLGDRSTSNPTEFARDAIALARRGITSLSVQAPWSDPQWFVARRAPDTDFGMSIGIVKDLRASLDLLVAQPNVDATSLAFVGHDFGAMFGAILSGIDLRPSYYVFIAGTSTLSEWYLLDKRRATDMNVYSAQMHQLDSNLYLADSHASAYLFQFARKDPYIPTARSRAFFYSAPKPRTMRVYETTHAMNSAAVFQDREAWLAQHLH